MDSSIDINTISIEYNTTGNNIPEMDARVENDISKISIQAIDFVTKSFGIISVLHTKPLEKGSVIRLFRLSINDSDENVILSYVVLFIYYNYFYKDKKVSLDDIINSDKNKIKVIEEVLKKKNITDYVLEQLYSKPSFITKRNNYYKMLGKCHEIKSVTTKIGVNYNFENTTDYEVSSEKFNKYIKEIGSKFIVKDECKIYIIKPVLQKGNESLWGGYYDNRPIRFKMLSNEFKTKAQLGDIKFNAGCYIICKISYNEEYDENDEIELKDMKVQQVYKFCNDGEIIKTLEGKKKESDKSYPEFNFKDKDDNNEN
jgi:hypothetical protein